MSDYSSSTIDLTLEDDDVSLSVTSFPRKTYSQITPHSSPKSHLLQARMTQRTPFSDHSSSTLPSAMSNGMANMAIQPPQIPQMSPSGSSQYLKIPTESRAHPTSLSTSPSPVYRPAFASNHLQSTSFSSPSYLAQNMQGSSQSARPQSAPPPPCAPTTSNNSPSNANVRNVIDLTTSPSPEPQKAMGLPADLPPKTPVCIGQLTVTALVLYPVSHLNSDNNQPGTDPDWTCVRLQYEHNPNKPNAQHTIHIKTPSWKGPLGEALGGETFGVAEQKIATNIGPMMGKGLIRLEARVRKGLPNVNFLSR
jgi:SWI/SNF-related matrix-associated actin-dependent regulator of chromatin subfamily A3